MITFEEIKVKATDYYNKGQTITGLFWVLKKLKIKNPKIDFIFREAAKPDFILLTTEGDFSKKQTIRIPKNILEFPLELILTMLIHEFIHVIQKTKKPFVYDKNEREWQAYYEMNFNQQFPQLPNITDFHKLFFAKKGLEYFERMGENSPLQIKYDYQKKQVEELISILEKKKKISTTIKEVNT